MRHIVFRWEGVVPSVNGLYFPRGGRLNLTTKGRAIKNHIVSSGGGVSAQELMSFQGDPNEHYQVHVWFYLPEKAVYTKTWGRKGGAAKRFKKKDVDNWLKLTLDCVSDLVGVDDSNNFTILAHKRIALDGVSRTVVVVAPLLIDHYTPEAILETLNDQE